MTSFGIDVLLASKCDWQHKRIALVTNHAATTNQFVASRKALLDKGFNIVKLFSPEHGLDVKGADGAKMADGVDSLTLLPIVSLYGDFLQPQQKDLEDVDVVLFDIPDVGCRFYTYLWTMTHVMEACARYQKLLVILDRPNPISGNISTAEGPMLDERNCSSFIGRWDIPLKHNCTLGELANYFNRSRNLHLNLEVIKCEGPARTMFQPDWGIGFVPTSPAIRSFEQVLLYPGLGLLEATNISEGRGTDLPFKMIGAPWLNSQELISSLTDFSLQGISFTSCFFTPSESKYANQYCNGIICEVTNKDLFMPVLLGFLLIKVVKDLHPLQFKPATYPTNVNPTGKGHLDKLTGIYESEKLFDLPLNVFIKKINSTIKTENWPSVISPYLLY